MPRATVNMARRRRLLLRLLLLVINFFSYCAGSVVLC